VYIHIYIFFKFIYLFMCFMQNAISLPPGLQVTPNMFFLRNDQGQVMLMTGQPPQAVPGAGGDVRLQQSAGTAVFRVRGLWLCRVTLWYGAVDALYKLTSTYEISYGDVCSFVDGNPSGGVRYWYCWGVALTVLKSRLTAVSCLTCHIVAYCDGRRLFTRLLLMLRPVAG